MANQHEDLPVGWVAFEISSELRERAEAVVADIRSASDRKSCGPELADVVLDMTDAGLHYYFLHPLETAGVGLVTRRAVDMAIGTAGRALPMVVRRTIKSLDDRQLLSIADFLDRILIREEQ